MNPETKKLLLLHDEDQAWEFPSNFNTEDIEKRARKVHSELYDKFGNLKFKDWMHNQDASFGLAIIFEPSNVKNLVAIQQLEIRFSNFGNLVTFSYEKQSLQTRQIIIELLFRNDFICVDSKEMNEPYDGIMSPNKVISTWWIRYFDWL